VAVRLAAFADGIERAQEDASIGGWVGVKGQADSSATSGRAWMAAEPESAAARRFGQLFVNNQTH